MFRHKLLLLTTAIAALGLCATAQSRKALRINEVMVVNDSSVVDDYGHHSAWIELFNSNFGPLDISSVYITNDPSNIKEPSVKKMYAVPLGDVLTRIPKRQHVLFWADNEPNRGTFHTNFVLTPGEDNWIAIYDADGKTLIDSVTVPAALPAGCSYARNEDGVIGDNAWSIRTGSTEKSNDYITPSSANVIKDANPKIGEFHDKDEHGFAMTIMAMGIVFSALLVLCLAFYCIGMIGKYFSRLNKARATGVDVTEVPVDEHDSGEEIAAIVMALHEHLNAHDKESTVLTINKVKRAYSPWSSKIYGLREIPKR